MRLLVATSRDNGNITYRRAPDGDILTHPYPCGPRTRCARGANKNCECRVAFTGLESRGWALAEIVERSDMDEGTLREAAHRFIVRTWYDEDELWPEGAQWIDQMVDWVTRNVINLGKATAHLPVGTVVKRQDDHLIACVNGVDITIHAPAGDLPQGTIVRQEHGDLFVDVDGVEITIRAPLGDLPLDTIIRRQDGDLFAQVDGVEITIHVPAGEA